MDTLNNLYEIIKQRKQDKNLQSYTNYLFENGLDKISKKIGEESMELVIAAKNNDKKEVINETSDLLYHILVLLANENIDFEEVCLELEERQSKMNNLKNFNEKGDL